MDRCIYCNKRLKYQEKHLGRIYWGNLMCPSCYVAKIKNARIIEELENGS